MRLATCARPGADSHPWLAAVEGEDVIDLAGAAVALGAESGIGEPTSEFTTMVDFFASGPDGRRRAEDLVGAVLAAETAGRPLRSADGGAVKRALTDVRLLAPVPRPRRIRDYLTYRQHATGAGVQVPPAFEAMPVCYQANADTIIGPGEVIPWPAYTDQLDYELEIGFFVGRGGRDLSAKDAASHIAGITLFNDVSARDIQLFEMSMTIGPSKGKDFCSVMGPVVLTMDEVGDEDAIELTARVNGEVWSHGTTTNRQYSFAEVLAWASYCENVYPGEFLAIGTVGGGCGLEIDRWVQPGDVVELEATGVGILRNPIGQKQRPPANAGLSSYRGAPWFATPHA